MRRVFEGFNVDNKLCERNGFERNRFFVDKNEVCCACEINYETP